MEHQRLLDALRAICGTAGVLTAPAAMAPYLEDWRGLFRGAALAVVRPASTAETAAVVRACAEAGVAMVPQAGNTGYCGGATPLAAGPAQVVLSVERMRRVRAVDADNLVIEAEAGVVLAEARAAAAAEGLELGISMGSEGSARIGGVIATNAGGVHVVRHGMTRAQVLGLEVVLPDGRVWDGRSRLRKDNTGYDLKQLFIGAEGTLGVVTAAVLALRPRPARVLTAWAAVPDLACALALAARARREAGELLAACEWLSAGSLALVCTHVAGTRPPLAADAGGHVLLELAAPAAVAVDACLEAILGPSIESGQVLDAVVATSEAQRTALWRLRESVPEAERAAGGALKHDVAVPPAALEALVARLVAGLPAHAPQARWSLFGHLGDGNLHANVWPLAAVPDGEALTAWVYDEVLALGGSFSAEHGIGQLRREALADRRDAVSIDLMRRLKRALDPQGLMNPGKVLP